jgi:hypothetical protein
MGNKRRAVTIVLAIVALVPLGYLSFLKLNRSIEEGLVKQKLVRETTGIVVSKNHLLFDESNKSYVDDEGRPIERNPGEEEWRVYYVIDDLDPIDEHTRTLLMAAEKKRREKGGPRFTIVSEEEYDYVQIGEKLCVSWRWIGGEKIEIVSAHKLVSAQYQENPHPCAR